MRKEITPHADRESSVNRRDRQKTADANKRKQEILDKRAAEQHEKAARQQEWENATRRDREVREERREVDWKRQEAVEERKRQKAAAWAEEEYNQMGKGGKGAPPIMSDIGKGQKTEKKPAVGRKERRAHKANGRVEG